MLKIPETPEVMLIPFTDRLMEELIKSTKSFSAHLDQEVHSQFPNQEFKEALPLFIQRRKQNREEQNLGFLILWRELNLVVGEIGAKVLPTCAEIEAGYGVVPGMRGRGIATEALRLFTRHCFSSGRVKTIRAGCLEANVGSIRVLEKAGFQRAGTKNTPDGPSISWVLQK